MKFAIFLALASALIPISGAADEPEPLSGLRFQGNPFVGVCQNVGLLSNKDYEKQKAYWDDVIPRCAPEVQILPDTGFFATVSLRLGEQADQAEAVKFLQRVGQRSLENLDFNNRMSELWVHCANKDNAWIEKKRAESAESDKAFYDPAQCGARLQQLKDLVKSEGKPFRINREMMKYTAGLGTEIKSVLRKTGDLATLGELDLILPGEKVKLSDDERKEVAGLTKEVDDKAHAELEKQKQELLARVKKAQEGKSALQIQLGAGLNEPGIPEWFHQWYVETDSGKNSSARGARPFDEQQLKVHRKQQFGDFFKKYSDTLGNARILAFLDSANPDDAAIAKAAQAMLANGIKTRKDTEKLLAVGTADHEDKWKILRMASLMKNGPVLRDLLKEDPSACHVAAGLANYKSNQNTGIAIGLFTAGIGAGVVGPALLAGAGYTAAAGALSTGATVVSTGGLLGSDAYKLTKAKQREFNEVHGHADVFGSGRAIADVGEYEDARDTLVVDVAVVLASAAVPAVYKEFFAGNAQKSEAMVSQLMKDPKAGGMGLKEAEARKLLSDAASTNKEVSSKAAEKIAAGMHVDGPKLSGTVDAVKHELEHPDPAGAANLTSKSFLERAAERLHLSHVSADPESYQRLRDTAIGHYFPGTAEVHVDAVTKATGANLTDAAVKDFQKDFDALLDQRAKLFNLNTVDFRKWLTKKYGTPYPKLDAVELENVFKKQGITLEQFQSGQYMQFAQESASKGINVFLHVSGYEVRRFAVWAGLGTLGFVASTAKNVLTLGPIMNVANGFFSAPMQPLVESAGQLSNIEFAGLTKKISSFTTRNMKALAAPVGDLSKTTNELDDTKFDGMSRDDAKKLMEGFDDRYAEIFTRMSKYMPPYMRGGRDTIRDWAVLQPVQIASEASVFSTQYTLNQMLLRELDKEAKDHPLSEEDQNIRKQCLADMAAAENRLAVALATWRIYTFMYAEVARDPTQADANAKMFDTLQHYENYMDMDKYREGLSAKIKEAFGQFDPSFKDLPKLEHRDPKSPQ